MGGVRQLHRQDLGTHVGENRGGRFDGRANLGIDVAGEVLLG